MKYGPIICDPTSEEAKGLVGKKVAYGWNFKELNDNPEKFHLDTLSSIDRDSYAPFVIGNGGFTFIREVIEELTYKPFNNFSDLLSTYFDKIQIESSRIKNFDFPTIWVKKKATSKEKEFFTSVCGGNDEEVFLSQCFPISYAELLDKFTFLDGSACGVLRGDVFN